MIVDVNAGNTAAGFGVCAQLSVAVATTACGVQVNPIGVAVVAPALIVCDPPLATVMAAAGVLDAPTVHTNPSDPVREPGVNTLTV